MYFSIIIPVYNRPDEVNELLASLSNTSYPKDFEIVIVEDGSTLKCKSVVEAYQSKLNIAYYYKDNSGPGDSRNFGMNVAKGDYFLIFDSDCIIPEQYLLEVEKELQSNYVDCFGGPDNALASFTPIQKAINFAMTSFITTGGIRGGSEKVMKFQPRSFNMGISKKAYMDSKGFGNIHPGEDPDLSIRLWRLGYQTRLFENAYVYHKRRIDWEKFTIQVSKFGKARPILDYWYPEYRKPTFWFPTLFMLGLIFSIFLLVFLVDVPLKLYFAYFVLVFSIASVQNKSVQIGGYAVVAVWKQFSGYGFGFLKSFFEIHILRKSPQEAFPELFFPSRPNQYSKVAVKEKVAVPPQPIMTDSKPIERTRTNIVGLTGGIGSGKTTIAQYMASIGVPVYISDLEARKVMELPEVSSLIAFEFGNEVLDQGIINREKLASVVFGSPEKLRQLNAIVHPVVKKHFDQWVASHKNDPFVIKEAAILFESGAYKDCDYIISVSAPLETRIQRVLNRDTTTREKVLQRISNQISDEERNAKSDFVIQNENFELVKNNINDIIKILKNK
jgi:dephospho-CoA kinase